MNQSDDASNAKHRSNVDIFIYDVATIAMGPRSSSSLSLYSGPYNFVIDSFLERCRSLYQKTMKTYVVSQPPLQEDSHLIHLEAMRADSSSSSSPTGGSSFPPSIHCIQYINIEEQAALTDSCFRFDNASNGMTVFKTIEHSLGYKTGEFTEKIIGALRTLSLKRDNSLLRWVKADIDMESTPMFFEDVIHGNEIITQVKSIDVYSEEALTNGSPLTELAINPLTNLFHLGFSSAFPDLCIELFIVNDGRLQLIAGVTPGEGTATCTYSFLTRYIQSRIKLDVCFRINSGSAVESPLSPVSGSPVRSSMASGTKRLLVRTVFC
jgi:hypothetical protein